jgi:hypothetical protein
MGTDVTGAVQENREFPNPYEAVVPETRDRSAGLEDAWWSRDGASTPRMLRSHPWHGAR